METTLLNNPLVFSVLHRPNNIREWNLHRLINSRLYNQSWLKDWSQHIDYFKVKGDLPTTIFLPTISNYDGQWRMVCLPFFPILVVSFFLRCPTSRVETCVQHRIWLCFFIHLSGGIGYPGYLSPYERAPSLLRCEDGPRLSTCGTQDIFRLRRGPQVSSVVKRIVQGCPHVVTVSVPDRGYGNPIRSYLQKYRKITTKVVSDRDGKVSHLSNICDP